MPTHHHIGQFGRLGDVHGRSGVHNSTETDQFSHCVWTAEPLVYLCISTVRGAEIVEYPDSGKIGAGVADATSPVGFRRLGIFRAGSGTLDYWESEPEAG